MKKEIVFALLAALCSDKLSADNLTRERLEELLAAIALQPAPDPETIYAMCYDMPEAVNRFEYVCPVCGAKTLYTRDVAYMLDRIQRWWRERMEDLRKRGLDAELDERACCSVCREDAELADENELAYYLIVRLDSKATRTRLHENDWARLSAFLDGKITWNRDGAKPLKPEIPRIRELLGLDEEPAPENEDE